MILCLGLPNSGKTLLLRSLSCYPDKIEKFETVSTVGINLVNLNCSLNESITIREIGGSMEPIWENYLNSNVTHILFTIDVSNPVEIGSNVITLINLFNSLSVKLCQPRLLLVLTKLDSIGTIKLDETISGLLVDDLISLHSLNNSIEIIGTSAITGQGLDDIIKWLSS
ncbi:ADP-ribosylation factor-like protein 16 [Panonychus citri]|uniref:ADP-ribosylation factor-like protein 16 n=1 Tax=Panonychus citri TaxID=50023 RepID=UPI002306F72B|nr:ADP-ribosylation factor-like protein 16 [Panonychus citri]